MVPIHDTDLAQERWAKAEWQNYELWERVELRLRRRRRLLIIATLIVFLVISSIPIVLEQWPKWTALTACRQLAQEIGKIKTAAGMDHLAYRIRFLGNGSLDYEVERATSCADPNPVHIRSGSLLKPKQDLHYALIDPEQGSAVEVPGLVSQFCYDALTGSQVATEGQPLVGFGVIPVKDLADHRLDHMAVLLLSGPSAELSFD